MSSDPPAGGSPRKPAPCRCLARGALCLLLSCIAVAAPPPDVVTRIEQMALARARALVQDEALALPLRDRISVGAYLARDLGEDRTVRLWLRGLPAAGPTRLYSDDVCEVDVRLEPAQIAEQLARLADGRPADPDGIDTAAIRAAAARWPELWGTGTAGAAEAADGPRPPGWEDVTAEGVELARQAAIADARHALLAAAEELKVTSSRTLGDFLGTTPALREALGSALERTMSARIECAADQLAVCQARVALPDLLRIVLEVREAHYHGTDFQPADFRDMVMRAGGGELTATGLAPPPRAARSAPLRDIELNAPAWRDRELSARGRFTPPPGETLDAAALRSAARLAGIALLRDQVLALPFTPQATVGDWLEYHPARKDDVLLFLSGARGIGAGAPAGGGYELEVRLPLRRLWDVLKADLRRVEVDPGAATQPTATQPAATQPAASRPTTRPATTAPRR